MTSSPINPDPDQIATEQLLAEATRATGYTPTWRQLRYWVHNGLLAEPQQKALGRGKGSVALWDREELPRLILILRARTGAKGRNIELQSARLLLTLKGSAPADTHQLRLVFDEYVAAYDVLTVKQQQERQQAAIELRDMIDHPPDRQSARMFAAMPDPGGRVMHTALALFVPEKDAADPWQRLGWYFSPEGLRATLAAFDNDQLYAAYIQAGTLLDAGLIQTPLPSQLPLPVSLPDLPPQLLACVPDGVELSDTDRRRLPATLALLETTLYGPQMAEAWIAAIKQLAPIAQEMAQRVAQHRSEANADASTLPPSKEPGAAQLEQDQAHDAPEGETTAPLG